MVSPLVEFVFRFAVDSLISTVYAFMWPVYWVQWRLPFGLIALGAGFFVFTSYLKQPITNWLFPNDLACFENLPLPLRILVELMLPFGTM